MIRVARAQEFLPTLLEQLAIVRAGDFVLAMAESMPQLHRRTGVGEKEVAQALCVQTKTQIELGYFQMVVGRIIQIIGQAMLAAQQAQPVMHGQGVLRAVDAIMLYRHFPDIRGKIAP